VTLSDVQPQWVALTDRFFQCSRYDLNKSWQRFFLVNIDKPKQEHVLLWSRSMKEHYEDPGWFVSRMLPSGVDVIRKQGDIVFLSGNGSNPNGDRPFLDQCNLKTKETRRLFRSSGSCLESFVLFYKDDFKSLLTWRQSADESPHVCILTLEGRETAAKGEATSKYSRRVVTSNKDPAPIVRKIKRRLVKYARDDGVQLSFELYTPPGYVEGTRVSQYCDSARSQSVPDRSR